MHQHPAIAFLARHRTPLTWAVVIGASVALILSVTQPFSYRASMRVLVIQSTSPSIDAFTAVKSAEKIGRNLGRVIGSSTFLDRVLRANPMIDASAFPQDERKRRRRWQRTVSATVAAETSVMDIDIYHPVQRQAHAIAEAVGSVLARDAVEYTGSRDVSMKVIDPPIVSSIPVRPNILLNILVGLLLGFAAGVAVLYIREGERR